MRTIEAQDVMIKRLEADLVASQEEARKLKEAYERRVRRVRVNSAKHKAESELVISELKEQLAAKATVQTSMGEGDDGPHTELIFSLSQQLAECHEELGAAKRELAKMRAK
mmetsp:Transcript_32987/g.99829  ORF Transcript_32987/g.99829 Transcript_32987/m.99829 type:complete len:111 (+) Transcript_32987:81-413(+)